MDAKNYDIKTEDYNSILFGLYNILFTNDTAIGYIYDALEMLDGSSLKRGSVKYRMRLLRNMLKDYNRVVSRLTKEQEFVADLNDIFADLISDDLKRLELTVENYMHKCHVPDVKLQSKVAIAYIFVQGACHNVDMNIERRQHISKLLGGYRRLRLTDILNALRCLMTELETYYHRWSYLCDLNENDDIFNGFVIICRKLADENVIASVIEKYDKDDV